LPHHGHRAKPQVTASAQSSGAVHARGAARPAWTPPLLAGPRHSYDQAVAAGALTQAGVDPARYLTISIDLVLAEMAARNLIPRIAGLSPLEGDFRRGPADQSHATVTADGQTLRAVCFGQRFVPDAVQSGDLRIDGDPNAARRVTRLLRTLICADNQA
jgi:hypothetical protein